MADQETDKAVMEANPEPEFEQGIAVDDNGELLIQLDEPTEDNSVVEDNLDATSTEEKPAESQLSKVSTGEVDTLKFQIEAMARELETKNQLLGMAKIELEKKIEQMKPGDNDQVEDLLETFADKDKGLKFLDGKINKAIDNVVNQRLGVLSEIVTKLVVEKAQDEFKSKHPEAFENGFLKQEVFDLMKPYTDRGVSWDEAYKPFKARFKGNDSKAIIAQKANKLRNTNNVGQTTGKVSAGDNKAINSLMDAWHKAEQDRAGIKK